jgi:hypothetical protein
MLNGSRTLGGSSVNEINRDCTGGCGGNIPNIFAYAGCCNVVNGYMWSSATDNTEDARAKIIDAPLTIIFKMGYGACSSHYYTKRLPIQSF